MRQNVRSRKRGTLFILASCLVFVLLKSLKLLEFIFSQSLNSTSEESADADLKFRHLVLFERAQMIHSAGYSCRFLISIRGNNFKTDTLIHKGKGFHGCAAPWVTCDRTLEMEFKNLSLSLTRKCLFFYRSGIANCSLMPLNGLLNFGYLLLCLL